MAASWSSPTIDDGYRSLIALFSGRSLHALASLSLPAALPYWPQPRIDSPDGDDFADVQRNATDLGDEDGCDSFVQGSAVHVDRGADGNAEPHDFRVDLDFVFEGGNGDGQRRRTATSNVS